MAENPFAASPPAPQVEQSETVADMPPPIKGLFHFAALLMRISDNGSVMVDLSSGYNRAYSDPEARREFSEAVRQAFPGFTITKISGGEIMAEPAEA